mgnify:CR=1 FL=1
MNSGAGKLAGAGAIRGIVSSTHSSSTSPLTASRSYGGGPWSNNPSWQHDLPTKLGEEQSVVLPLAKFLPSFGGQRCRSHAGGPGDLFCVQLASRAEGVGGAAQFNSPAGLAISPDGSALFVADLFNHKIRRVEVATGAVTTLAGLSLIHI